MSTVPRMSLVIPLRRRLEFTSNILPTAIHHASREHDIVLILDMCPLEYELQRRPEHYPGPAENYLAPDTKDRERVYRWIDDHQSLLAEHRVRVLECHGHEGLWTGGMRSGAATNLGVEKAETEWIVGIGDEDLVFLPGWDEALWRGLEGEDPNHAVSTLTMIMPYVRSEWPHPLTKAWIEAQRAAVSNTLALPILQEHANTPLAARIHIDTLRRFCAIAAESGIYSEPCGVRDRCHWVPMLMHRPLLDRVGRWPVTDEWAFSYDLGNDNALGALGVSRRMPLDEFVLHTKQRIYLSDAVDREWGDSWTLELLRGRPIL